MEKLLALCYAQTQGAARRTARRTRVMSQADAGRVWRLAEPMRRAREKIHSRRLIRRPGAGMDPLLRARARRPAEATLRQWRQVVEHLRFAPPNGNFEIICGPILHIEVSESRDYPYRGYFRTYGRDTVNYRVILPARGLRVSDDRRALIWADADGRELARIVWRDARNARHVEIYVEYATLTDEQILAYARAGDIRACAGAVARGLCRQVLASPPVWHLGGQQYYVEARGAAAARVWAAESEGLMLLDQHVPPADIADDLLREVVAKSANQTHVHTAVVELERRGVFAWTPVSLGRYGEVVAVQRTDHRYLHLVCPSTGKHYYYPIPRALYDRDADTLVARTFGLRKSEYHPDVEK